MLQHQQDLLPRAVDSSGCTVFGSAAASAAIHAGTDALWQVCRGVHLCMGSEGVEEGPQKASWHVRAMHAIKIEGFQASIRGPGIDSQGTVACGGSRQLKMRHEAEH